MRTKVLILVLAGCLAGSLGFAQETPKSLVASYDALADTILALRRAEAGFMRALLDGHRHAAEARMKGGDWQGCAAEIALFANEGDNAVGGVRKRLLEGGHHHNAAGEEQGLYEPGFVIVTSAAKKDLLAVAKSMREAKDDAARKAAWEKFSSIAGGLLAE